MRRLLSLFLLLLALPVSASFLDNRPSAVLVTAPTSCLYARRSSSAW